TKVKNEEPTYYANTSKVSTSQFASGSIIEGEVVQSVLSRNIYVHKDSVVKDSILFPRVVIGQGVQVEYAILDKGVEVADGVVIRGTAEHP
ncbi:glucose-1-phosphate adenylyltransferase subunit GlgD, partial [Streptococcus pneumoniae]|nr:glucose-1-phosphate adenylyltransferase subunit GlgD [Streptococcus pneumoniae]